MDLRRLVLAALGVSLIVTSTSAAPGASAISARQQDAPTSQPLLNLTLADLPPGYRDAGPGTVETSDGPTDAQAFIRTSTGTGPAFIISTIVFGQGSVAAEIMARTRREWAELGDGTRRAQTGELSGCTAVEAAGLGEDALAYRCTFEWAEDVRRPAGEPPISEMMGITFRRSNILGNLVIMSSDGRIVEDTRRLADAVDARISASIRGQQP